MAAAQTYEPIATQTLGSAVATVTFSSIPSTYTDIILVSVPISAAAQDMYFRINGDSGTNYSRVILYGTGSAAGSTLASNQTLGMANYYGNPDPVTKSNQTLHFMNYSNSTTYKSILVRANNAAGGTDAMLNLWRSTSAITSIELRVSPSATVNFSTGSVFTLYGIKAA